MKLLTGVICVAVAFAAVCGMRAIASCSTSECFETSCYLASENSCTEYKLTSAFNGYSTAGGGTRTEKTGKKTSQRTGPDCNDECPNALFVSFHAGDNCGNSSETWTDWSAEDMQSHYCKEDY